MLAILNILRENPIENTNVIFVGLYQSKYKIKKLIAGNDFLDNIFSSCILIWLVWIECWEHEPDKRPDIRQVNLELKILDSENNNASSVFYSKEREASEKIESEDSDFVKLQRRLWFKQDYYKSRFLQYFLYVNT